MNSASTSNATPPFHARVAPNQVPPPAPHQTSSYSIQQQMPAGTYYPTANWQAPGPTWPTAPAFPSSFPSAPSSHTPLRWNHHALGTFPPMGQQSQLLESAIGDFAVALVEKMRPILHGIPDVREAERRSEGPPQTPSESERLHETNRRRVSSWRNNPSPPPSGTASPTPSSLSEPPPSERSMRGMELAEFHADTYIPPSDYTTKPQAPPGDPSGNVATFTDDEKIFFIHCLRWQLREARLLPPKEVICWYLANEAPQHDHLSWKKHWDDHPSLPDRIFIEARKRFEGRTSTVESASDPPVTLRLSSKSSDARNIHPYPDRGRKAARRGRQPVTDDDIRAMALYMVEKRRVWDKFKNHFDCWKEFARRPQNQERRNLHAWNSAALHHARRIQEVFDEFMGWDKELNSEGPERHRTRHRVDASV
ncbi:hypothetical protein C8Q80DRAFT_1268086 [Daedaleopsis nitida]|nr:hypothetical protein C8Q80DRAFT_1268086 [Daedaleopsis nitida]